MRLFYLLVISLAALPAFAADHFYFGTWKIESATIAPWWDSVEPPDPAESKQLVGKTIVIGPAGITGPRQLACKEHKYEVHEAPVEGLFQGMFDEMHRRNSKFDPAKAAAKVGFRGTKWQTLETGCGNEIDYHFLDPNTTSFGLNNYIFILKKK